MFLKKKIKFELNSQSKDYLCYLREEGSGVVGCVPASFTESSGFGRGSAKGSGGDKKGHGFIDWLLIGEYEDEGEEI